MTPRPATFHLESWENFAADPQVQALWAEHYGELAADPARMPMGPDGPFYAFLDRQGMLQLLTVRRAGRIVGYCLVVVKPHPHYRTVLCGFEDSYFLTASERRGGVGVMMIAESIRRLRLRGVKKVFFMTKVQKNLRVMFERLGFTHCDEVMSKWIGAEGPEGA